MPDSLILGLIVAVIAFLLWRRAWRSLWYGTGAFYAGLVAYRCFLNRVPGSYGTVDLKLFATVESVSGYHYFIDNILLFLPCGILMMIACRSAWKSVIIGAAVSLAIEMLQLVTALGGFRVDDLLANGLGTAVGVALTVPVLRGHHGKFL